MILSSVILEIFQMEYGRIYKSVLSEDLKLPDEKLIVKAELR